MGEHRASGGFLRLPAGFLGMLALIAAVECLLSRHAGRYVETAKLGWRFSAEAAAHRSRGRDVLFLGDSQVKLGLVPSVVQRASGLSAYNLAAPRASAPATFFLLRHALEQGARPRAIVVDFAPSILAAGPQRLGDYWAEVADARDLVDLVGVARRADWLPEAVTKWPFPSARHRAELRDGIVSALAGREDPGEVTNRACLRNWRLNDGSNVSPENPSYRDELNDQEHKFLFSPNWPCDRVNRVFVERLLRLAEAEKIRVYWLLAPTSPALQARRDRSGAEAAFERVVRSIVAGHPGVTILDARRSGFPSRSFVDPTHLSGRGAAVLSRAVGDELARKAEVGWIRLRPDFSASTGDDLEDVQQSRLALDGQTSRLR